MKNILFIGSGNMASAIANGLSKSKLINDENIFLYDKNPSQYLKFPNTFSIVNSVLEGIEKADYIFLSVKPQNIKDVLSEITTDISNKVFISICAGITMESIEAQLENVMLVRAMPNTPLLIGQGVTAVCKNRNVSLEDFEFIKSIFASCGIVTEIDEKDINALTAITSSSPAYIYSFIKAMYNGAISLGFNYKNTIELICKTFIGAANLVLSNNEKTLDEQIAMVKSPNGTTEKALNVFEDRNIENIIIDAMDACKKRAEELSKLNN